MKKPIDSEKMERARRALEMAEKKRPMEVINQFPMSVRDVDTQNAIDLFLSVYNHKSVTPSGRKAILGYLKERLDEANDTFVG